MYRNNERQSHFNIAASFVYGNLMIKKISRTVIIMLKAKVGIWGISF